MASSFVVARLTGVLMYGSTMFMVQVTERPLAHPKLWATAGATPGAWSLAAGMATSGTLTTWLRERTGASRSRR